MTQPRTSPTQQPGYGTTPTGPGVDTHANWMDAFVSYLSSRWAHGDHSIVPPGQYGIPDATDNGYASPATMLAFSQWAANYHPGDNSQVDGMMPYIAPGPNDYIESPAQTAARVAQDNWEATFGQTQTNADRLAWQQEFANEVQSYGYQVAGANNANDFAANLFQTQAGMANSANSLAGSIYNTQGGMYNANEGNRATALGNAGTLASQLQGMWDKRTDNAITLQAHPNDFIERESAVRALNAPEGSDIPAYKNVDALQEVINRLINFTPSAAMPTAPTPAAQPQMPTYGAGAGAQPTPPQPTPFTPSTPRLPSGGAYPPQDGVSRNGITNQPPGYTPPGSTGGITNIPGTFYNGRRPVTLDPTVAPDASGYRWDSANSEWVDPGHGNAAYVPHAQGTGAGTTTDRRMIIGDPQASGQPNPELVTISGKNVHTRITPLAGMIPQYAYGTDKPGEYGAGYDGLMTNGGFSGVSYGSTTPAPTYQQPNHPVSSGGGLQAYATSTPTSMAAGPGNGWAGPSTTPATPTTPPVTQAPQVTLKSYPDSAYQGLPSLQYLLGRMGRGQYNTLATGAAQGAFGTQAPESGSINYRRALDIANDPVSQALIESIYSSANRDYLSEVSRAKARAPFGQAVNTSLVRT